MGDNNKKIITVCFVAAGFLTFLVVGILLNTLAASFSVFAQINNLFWVKHVVPVGLGVVAFGLLQFNPKVVAWAEEVVVEIGKVVWPTRQQTVGMTIIVCIMVLISGVILGLLDILSGQAFNAGIVALRDLF
jgi:preprotein translocase SecE subunit